MNDYCIPHSKARCGLCLKAWERKCDFGLFVWNAENHYTPDKAVHIYRRKGPAEAKAAQLNPMLPAGHHGYVVRSLYRGAK